MTNKHISEALRVFDLEAKAILQLKNQLTDDFSKAIQRERRPPISQERADRH